jgi:hypothetical protein
MNRQILAISTVWRLGFRAIVALCLGGLLAISSGTAHAQGGVVNSTQNPLQLALLHWDAANQVPTQFGVAYFPEDWHLTGRASGLPPTTVCISCGLSMA